jgi:hypothetical protein
MTESSKLIRRYTSISAVIDLLHRRELAILDPQSWDDRNDRYFMDLYKEKKKIGGLYGLCAAQCSETYHHWRVFTNTADGACVEINREPLEAVLGQLNGVRFGPMDYLRLDEVEHLTRGDVDRLPFVKRIGFAAEEEYRIVAETDEPQVSVFKIDFELRWIKHIYLNPWLPKSIAESVIGALKAIRGCSRLEVTRSLLIESSRWKRAGEKVIGKLPPKAEQRIEKKQRRRLVRASASRRPRKGR